MAWYRVFRMMTTGIVLGMLLQGPVWAQGFGNASSASLTPASIRLTKDTVTRLLKILPEIAKDTKTQQAQLLGALGNASAIPSLSPKALEALNKSFKKHGLTMGEFVMQVSALLATYFVVRPDMLEAQLPNEDNPEIKKILNDPTRSQTQKDMLRRQIAFAQKNKSIIRKQWEQMASAANKRVVRSMLPQINKVFEALTQANTGQRTNHTK